MAYLNFAEPMALAPAVMPPPRTAVLSALEWSVVALARRDSLSSLRAPSRIGVALAALFGGGTSSSLSDPRLETLRRVAVHAWHHGYGIPEAEIRDFHAEGFTPEHLELVVTSISRARRERRKARP